MTHLKSESPLLITAWCPNPTSRALALTLGALAFATSPAHAETAFGPTHGTVERIDSPEPGRVEGDGVYGRFNGDLSLQIGGGLESDFVKPTFRPLLIGDISVYQTIGLYGAFRESVASSDPWQRALSTGLVLSPLFLVRWPRAWESGAATWDLAVDSLSIVGGVSFVQESAKPLFDSPRAELGLQVGVPLLGRANGLFLRARGQVTSGEQWAPAAWLWISWQGFVHTGLLSVDR